MIRTVDRIIWSLACFTMALDQIIRALKGFDDAGFASISGWFALIAIPASILFAIRAWVVR